MNYNDNNIVHSHNGKTHSHPILYHICSSVYVQFGLENENITDSEEVKEKKEEIKLNGENEETLYALGRALCLQLRYRECIDVCKKILSINKDSFKAKRLLAIRYLTTGQNKEAYETFSSLKEVSDDPLDISYRLGLSLFYEGKYNESKPYFIESLNLSKNNPEMYIASLYWYLFVTIELNEDISTVLSLYYPMDVGHHLGYKYAIDLFLGKDMEEVEELSKRDNLTRIMYLLGKYYYFKYKNDNENKEKAFKEGIETDEFWASFSGLAFWNKYFKRNK